MMHRIDSEITRLTDSFRLGNTIKKGVAVAIVGEPNVGKSTLLNRLLGGERALVSDIAPHATRSKRRSILTAFCSASSTPPGCTIPPTAWNRWASTARRR